MIKTARATLYRGTLMRSRLEARVAGFLDRAGLGWDYEPIVFADAAGQWLPDFRVRGLLDVPLYIDVKGITPSQSELDALLVSMAVVWASEPRAAIAVWADEWLRAGAWFVVRRAPGRPVERLRVARCPVCLQVRAVPRATARGCCGASGQDVTALRPSAAL